MPIREDQLLCPSAQPDMRDAKLLGVVTERDGAPLLSYIDQPVPVTAELLEMAQPANPIQVMRFSARCEQNHCTHFDGVKCNLATRIVSMLPPVIDNLPACLIRGECRWFKQEGAAACHRCPQVVTMQTRATDLVQLVAMGKVSDPTPHEAAQAAAP